MPLSFGLLAFLWWAVASNMVKKLVFVLMVLKITIKVSGNFESHSLASIPKMRKRIKKKLELSATWFRLVLFQKALLSVWFLEKKKTCLTERAMKGEIPVWEN